jgi:hypothetical protein
MGSLSSLGGSEEGELIMVSLGFLMYVGYNLCSRVSL